MPSDNLNFKPWSEFTADLGSKYKSASPELQESVRVGYYDKFLAPNIAPEEQESAKNKFLTGTIGADTDKGYIKTPKESLSRLEQYNLLDELGKNQLSTFKEGPNDTTFTQKLESAGTGIAAGGANIISGVGKLGLSVYKGLKQTAGGAIPLPGNTQTGVETPEADQYYQNLEQASQKVNAGVANAPNPDLARTTQIGTEVAPFLAVGPEALATDATSIGTASTESLFKQGWGIGMRQAPSQAAVAGLTSNEGKNINEDLAGRATTAAEVGALTPAGGAIVGGLGDVASAAGKLKNPLSKEAMDVSAYKNMVRENAKNPTTNPKGDITPQSQEDFMQQIEEAQAAKPEGTSLPTTVLPAAKNIAQTSDKGVQNYLNDQNQTLASKLSGDILEKSNPENIGTKDFNQTVRENEYVKDLPIQGNEEKFTPNLTQNVKEEISGKVQVAKSDEELLKNAIAGDPDARAEAIKKFNIKPLGRTASEISENELSQFVSMMGQKSAANKAAYKGHTELLSNTPIDLTDIHTTLSKDKDFKHIAYKIVQNGGDEGKTALNTIGFDVDKEGFLYPLKRSAANGEELENAAKFLSKVGDVKSAIGGTPVFNTKERNFLSTVSDQINNHVTESIKTPDVGTILASPTVREAPVGNSIAGGKFTNSFVNPNEAYKKSIENVEQVPLKAAKVAPENAPSYNAQTIVTPDTVPDWSLKTAAHDLKDDLLNDRVPAAATADIIQKRVIVKGPQGQKEVQAWQLMREDSSKNLADGLANKVLEESTDANGVLDGSKAVKLLADKTKSGYGAALSGLSLDTQQYVKHSVKVASEVANSSKKVQDALFPFVDWSTGKETNAVFDSALKNEAAYNDLQEKFSVLSKDGQNAANNVLKHRFWEANTDSIKTKIAFGENKGKEVTQTVISPKVINDIATKSTSKDSVYPVFKKLYGKDSDNVAHIQKELDTLQKQLYTPQTEGSNIGQDRLDTLGELAKTVGYTTGQRYGTIGAGSKAVKWIIGAKLDAAKIRVLSDLDYAQKLGEALREEGQVKALKMLADTPLPIALKAGVGYANSNDSSNDGSTESTGMPNNYRE